MAFGNEPPDIQAILQRYREESMKVPMCKLCQKAHWSYEDHILPEPLPIPEYIQDMALGAMGLHQGPPSQLPGPVMSPQEPIVPTSVPTDKCACGNKREGRHSSCAACRKRAYRERSK